MKFRRHLPSVLVVAVVATTAAAAATAGSNTVRTIRVNWRDAQPLDGGHLVYRTRKIELDGMQFSVTVSITNRTKYAIRFFPSGPYDRTAVRPPMFGLAFRPVPQPGIIQPRTLRSVPARTFSRPLLSPHTLGIGRTWTGTFSGRSRLLRTHRTWWVTFGLAAPWKGKHAVASFSGRHDSYWVSDKTFST